MAFNPPTHQPSHKGGMMFVNPPGMANYRALRVEAGDQHLYWQPTYQHLLRVEGAFGEFFPQAEFSDNGNQVIFTKYVNQAEVLSQTRPLRSGEKIPRGEWKRFLETWSNFKRLADRTDIPEDVRSFIQKFGPPSVERYPAAYRIYRPHWYSKPRLFVLWGLEPVGGIDFIAVTPEEAVSQGTARAETDGEESASNLLRWLKIVLVGLLALACILFLAWCLLPCPEVDFEAKAEAGKPAKTSNLTKSDRSVEWGERAYGWSFSGAVPAESTEFEPSPVWQQPGAHRVTLEATQSALWGLLYKTGSKTAMINVQTPPVPTLAVVPYAEKSPSLPGDSPRTEAPIHGSRPGRGMGEPPSKGQGLTDGSSLSKGNSSTGATSAESKPNGSLKGETIPAGPAGAAKSGPMASGGKVDSGSAAEIRNGNPKDVAKAMPSNPDGGPGAFDMDAGSSSPKRPEKNAGTGKIPAQRGKTMDGMDAGKTASGASKEGESPERAPLSGKKMSPDSKDAPEIGGDQGNRGSIQGMRKSDEAPSAGRGATKSMENAERGSVIEPGAEDKGRSPSNKAPNGSGVTNPGTPPMQDEARGPIALPVPSVEIRDAVSVGDGKAQKIDFMLMLPSGVRIERVVVDGVAVKVGAGGDFSHELPLGKHKVTIDYGSPTSELRGQVTQDLLVDAEQIKIIKPKTQIAPPKKVDESPSKDPGVPLPVKPGLKSGDKFDKKSA